jgi:4-amino-4-deoxy-L-arabinose transferase-like glycosyltransferase
VSAAKTHLQHYIPTLARRFGPKTIGWARKITDLSTLVLPPGIVLMFFLTTSFYGLNFGFHWDENRAKFDSVQNSVATGLFMQAAGKGRNYNYGGVNYLLTWSGFVPELMTYLRNGHLTRERLSAVIMPIVYATNIRLRVRAIYVVLSSLSIVWLFCLSLVLGRSRMEAFLAAAALGCSWEIAYHSRWIAPDVVMMHFALLSFLCLALGLVHKRLRWLYIGAVAIGLTVGTKYTGGLILPFFLAGAAYMLWQTRRSIMLVISHGSILVALSGFTFAITTPGAVLDPFRFFDEIRVQREIYSTRWYGYTVRPGLHHFGEMLKYIALQVFSHYWVISIIFTVFCLVGLVSFVKERRLFLLLVTAFLLGHLAFFAQQSAMIVRNLLVVVPYLCLAVARGISVITDRFGQRLRIIVYTFLAIALTINVAWEIYAARQIKLRGHSEYFLNKFVDYVQRSPKDLVLVSEKLSAALNAARIPFPTNLVTNQDASFTKVAFFQTEGPDRFWHKDWPSNWWGMYDRNFGSLEVNLDAYSTFIGNERILVMSRAHFKRLPMTENDLKVLPDP